MFCQSYILDLNSNLLFMNGEQVCVYTRASTFSIIFHFKSAYSQKKISTFLLLSLAVSTVQSFVNASLQETLLSPQNSVDQSLSHRSDVKMQSLSIEDHL